MKSQGLSVQAEKLAITVNYASAFVRQYMLGEHGVQALRYYSCAFL